jgi:ATP-dependent protease ClpP protease subunit
MLSTEKNSLLTKKEQLKKERGFRGPPVNRIVEYLGTVNYATSERILGKIKALLIEAPEQEICMLVTSTGGPTGTAMSFYDSIRYVLKPKLTTIGAGDVDSSGILLFLAGDKRYVTPNTTLLLHLAGRIFDGGTRFTMPEIEAMVREDKLKDLQYASVVAERSGGHLTTEKVLSMMQRNTLLTPQELVSWGLADSILEEMNVSLDS